jgi:hypothetical protein
MDPPRRRLSELSSQELSRRAAEYRRMALEAHGEATIQSLNMLAARYAMLAARHEVEEASAARPTPCREQSEVHELIELALQASSSVADPVAVLADTIKIMAKGDADPYLTMGVLVEGAVHILRTSLPSERQADTACALRLLLDVRLQATDHAT